MSIEQRECHDISQGLAYPAPPLASHVTVQTVVDIGAHVGAAAQWFHQLWPEAAIWCYEPDPGSARILRQNCPYAKVYQIALAAESEPGWLYQNKATSLMNSLYPCDEGFKAGQKATDYIPVDVICSSIAFRSHPSPNVIKLDAEGSEPCIMAGRTLRHFQEAQVVYLEFHRWQDRLLLDDALRQTHVLFNARVHYSVNRGELAYVRLDAIDHDKLNALRIPERPRELR